MKGVFLGLASALMGADLNNGAPTGALAAWTSRDPLVVQAREHVLDGRLREALDLLDSEPAGTGTAATACREMREVIRRIRREYRLSEEQLLRKLKTSIPDASAADLARWREAGHIQFRILDDQVAYFNREPTNLLRFCEEAARRRDEHLHRTGSPAKAPGTGSKLLEHLAEVIQIAESTGRTQVLPIRHRIRYRLTVSPNAPGGRAGSLVRCWLPFPQEYRQQQDVKLLRTSPDKHTIAPAAVDGSPISGAAQRTVYLEQTIADPARPLVFEEEFEYVSWAYYPRLSDDAVRPLPEDFERSYLEQRPPHIVFTPQIRDTARHIVGEETNPLTKVRKIFHWLDANVPWCAEEEYSIIPSFCEKAIRARRGDCGVQTSLFIALCRVSGVPARWQSGWETQPWGWNMHDWAEFYVEPWGWLPVDVSYGLQKSDDPRIREFYIGHQDAYRLIVNLDYGRPLHPPKIDFRSEPADFQRGEVELDGRNLYFDNWNYDIRIECQPDQENG
jgi:transglutaminase-like putative cysteine protease